LRPAQNDPQPPVAVKMDERPLSPLADIPDGVEERKFN